MPNTLDYHYHRAVGSCTENHCTSLIPNGLSELTPKSFLMPNPPPKPNNPFLWSTLHAWWLVCGGFLAYLLVFLSQPSVVGFVGSAGEPLSRLVDIMQIFLVDQLLGSVFGNGRLEISFVDRIPILLATAAWVSLAWLLGSSLLSRMSVIGNLSWLEKQACRALVGLAVLSTLTLLLGLSGLLSNRWALLAVVVALAVCAIVDGRLRGDVGRQLKPGRAELVSDTAVSVTARWLSRLVPPFTIGLTVVCMLGSCMPPWEFDVVEYHLQAPKEFFHNGKISFIEHNVYANMPLGAEMHSLAAMVLVGGTDGWWLGGIIGKVIVGSFSLLTAALLGGFCARKFGRWNGWVAAGLLLAMPGVAHVTMAGLIDMVLAAYLLGAMIVLTELLPKISAGEARVGDLFPLCFMAGAASACKYTGLLYVVVPIYAAIAWNAFRSHSRRQVVSFVAAGFFGLLGTCIPWFAKNYWQTGNPVYPLAAGVFRSRGLSVEQVAQWQVVHRVPISSDGGTAYSLVELWASVQQLCLQSNFLHPSLFFLLVCGVLATTNRRVWAWHSWPNLWIATAAWLLSVWWLATHRIDRFWLPVVPIWCALASVGVQWIAQRLSLGLAAAIVMIGLVYGGFMSVSGAFVDNRFFVSLSALREDIGDEEHSGRLSPWIGWVNQRFSDPNLRLLLIGEAKAFDFQPSIVYATCFNINAAERWLRGKTVAEQKSRLSQEGITHILINWTELARYRAPGNYGFSDWPQLEDVASLIDTGVVQTYDTPFEDADIQVLEVVTPNPKSSSKPE